jgi:hypothetical protein
VTLFTAHGIAINLSFTKTACQGKDGRQNFPPFSAFLITTPGDSMKKLTLVATAIMGLLSTSAAMAQSTVTVYGILDAGFNHVSGLRNGSFNGIASGIMEGSRFGFGQRRSGRRIQSHLHPGSAL